MKHIKFPKNSFIKGYFIKPKICDELIKFFKKVPNNYKQKGSVRNSEDNKVIRKDIKESTDYGLVPRSGVYPFTEYEAALQECLNEFGHNVTVYLSHSLQHRAIDVGALTLQTRNHHSSLLSRHFLFA